MPNIPLRATLLLHVPLGHVFATYDEFVIFRSLIWIPSPQDPDQDAGDELTGAEDDFVEVGVACNNVKKQVGDVIFEFLKSSFP